MLQDISVCFFVIFCEAYVLVHALCQVSCHKHAHVLVCGPCLFMDVNMSVFNVVPFLLLCVYGQFRFHFHFSFHHCFHYHVHVHVFSC
jgi:hypothetical protein